MDVEDKKRYIHALLKASVGLQNMETWMTVYNYGLKGVPEELIKEGEIDWVVRYLEQWP